jgi:uncharacterized membrane protein YqjE
VRALWSLPRAAPALLRHVAAYIELAAMDFARAQREVTAQLVALAVVAICAFFALLFGCFGVIAYTWDTPYRVAAIAWMCGGFVLVAVVAAVYRSKLARARTPFLADVQREWQEDRVILEHILSSDEE